MCISVERGQRSEIGLYNASEIVLLYLGVLLTS